MRVQSYCMTVLWWRVPHPRANTTKPKQSLYFVWVLVFAEDEGFEPSKGLTPWQFSKLLLSTTQPIFQYIRPAQIVTLREHWPRVCRAHKFAVKHEAVHVLPTQPIFQYTPGYFLLLHNSPCIRPTPVYGSGYYRLKMVQFKMGRGRAIIHALPSLLIYVHHLKAILWLR